MNLLFLLCLTCSILFYGKATWGERTFRTDGNGKNGGKYNGNLVKDSNFTYFMLTQSWPTTTCFQGEDEDHKCDKTLNVTGWLIHGLWPSGGRSKEGPEECNMTSKFDPEAVRSLMPELKKYWANLYIDTPPNDFWEHEWSKHGTCAASVKETATQYLYFKKTLDLFKSNNLTKILNDLEFFPNDTHAYNVNDMLDGLKGKLGGIEPILACYKSKQDERFYVNQIEICYDKQFNMVDCLKQRSNDYLFFKSLKDSFAYDNLSVNHDDHVESCPKGGEAYYPTIHG